MTQKDRYEALGRWCLAYHRDHECSDIDGGDIQDKATALGLLEVVEVTEPCGESCYCADYFGEFPAPCLRLVDET